MVLAKSDWEKSYLTGRTPWREEVGDVTEFLRITRARPGPALDLGCGTGEWAIAITQHGFDVEALDYSSQALSIAQSLSDAPHWVNWDLEDLANYPFRHETYELVIDWKVLAFIKDKTKYLDQVRAVLHGTFALTVFHELEKAPDICVPLAEFNQLILPRFDIIEKEVIKQPGKVSATYYLK